MLLLILKGGYSMNEYQLLSKLFYSDKDKYNSLYIDRINSESTLKFDIKIAENQTFCVITAEMTRKIDKIYRKIQSINLLLANIPDIACSSYIRNCLKDEIMMTNKIEGINTTRKQVQDIIEYNETKGADKTKKFSFFIEKYLKLINKEIIDLNSSIDLRNLYDELFGDDLDDDEKLDGKIFRSGGVNIATATDKIIHQGVYPESRIIKYVDSMLSIAHDEDMPILIKIAVVHYFFGYIHPFYDGNGRISRFLSSYLLQSLHNLLPFRLSYVINENKKIYYKAFEICNDTKSKGDITPFVLMFLEIIEQVATNIVSKFTEASEKLKHYSKFKTNINKKLDDILFILIQDYLFGDKQINQQELCSVTNISSKSTLNKYLTELLNLDLIKKEKNGRSYIYYVNIDKIDELMG